MATGDMPEAPLQKIEIRYRQFVIDRVRQGTMHHYALSTTMGVVSLFCNTLSKLLHAAAPRPQGEGDVPGRSARPIRWKLLRGGV